MSGENNYKNIQRTGTAPPVSNDPSAVQYYSSFLDLSKTQQLNEFKPIAVNDKADVLNFNDVVTISSDFTPLAQNLEQTLKFPQVNPDAMEFKPQQDFNFDVAKAQDFTLKAEAEFPPFCNTDTKYENDQAKSPQGKRQGWDASKTQKIIETNKQLKEDKKQTNSAKQASAPKTSTTNPEPIQEVTQLINEIAQQIQQNSEDNIQENQAELVKQEILPQEIQQSSSSQTTESEHSDLQNIEEEKQQLLKQEPLNIETERETPKTSAGNTPKSVLPGEKKIYESSFIRQVKNEFKSIPEILNPILHRVTERITKDQPKSQRPPRRPMQEHKRGGRQSSPIKQSRQKDLAWRIIDEKAEEIMARAKKTTERLNAEIADEEKIKRRIQITLNKLAEKNLQRLSQQLFEYGTQQDDYLRLLVQGIFYKACVEPKYTNLYAKVCIEISTLYFQHQFGNTEESKRPRNMNNLFRKILLLSVQNMFEYDHTEEDLSGLSPEEAQIKMNNIRRKVLGNPRLIAELFTEG